MAPESDFITAFESLNKTTNLPLWIAAHRLPAQKAFLAKGFPTLKDEEWKYTNLKDIGTSKFSLGNTQGNAHLDVSDPNITIDPLEKACLEKETLVQFAIKLSSQVAQNAFSLLNDALLGEGFLVHVKKGAKVGNTLHLTHKIAQAPQASAIFPRNIVILEEGTELCLVETEECSPTEGETALLSPLTDIILHENATLMYIKTFPSSQESTTSSFVISHTRCHLGKNARLLGFVDRAGPKLSREGLSVMLGGNGSEVRLWGLFHTRGNEHLDYNVNVEHAASFTVSRQFFKGVAEDNSRGVFCGKIRVGHGLHKVDARQLTKNLILGPTAEIDAKPHLEINSDDVKCTHGSAIGKLRDEEVFYLQTRGIGRQKAESILSKAFTREVILAIKEKRFQENVRKHARGGKDGS
ncbi:MAG: SufD family Fe-S cluster assembly protein [Deltaproteobacteria bacterium]|nr:SufD family Fe-S cluster assembly protein [Deltaproteobacteria bacterium]